MVVCTKPTFKEAYTTSIPKARDSRHVDAKMQQTNLLIAERSHRVTELPRDALGTSIPPLSAAYFRPEIPHPQRVEAKIPGSVSSNMTHATQDHNVKDYHYDLGSY